MGTAGHLGGDFRTAIRTGSYGAAMRVARSLPRLDLLQALELTVLAAEHAPDRYEEMARRWLCRLLAENNLDLTEITYALAALRQVADHPATGADLAEWVRRRPLTSE